MGDTTTIKMARMEEHVKNLEQKVEFNHVDTTKQITEVKSSIEHLGQKIENYAINAAAIKTLGEKYDAQQKDISKMKRYRWVMPTIVGVLSAVGSPILIYLIIKAIEG